MDWHFVVFVSVRIGGNIHGERKLEWETLVKVGGVVERLVD